MEALIKGIGWIVGFLALAVEMMFGITSAVVNVASGVAKLLGVVVSAVWTGMQEVFAWLSGTMQSASINDVVNAVGLGSGGNMSKYFGSVSVFVDSMRSAVLGAFNSVPSGLLTAIGVMGALYVIWMSVRGDGSAE